MQEYSSVADGGIFLCQPPMMDLGRERGQVTHYYKVNWHQPYFGVIF